VCKAPKKRFGPYAGAGGKGVNSPAAMRARVSGPSGATRGNRAASGEGVDPGDGGKLAAGAVAILLAVGALYATLQSQF
jgi:hypothetical protein